MTEFENAVKKMTWITTQEGVANKLRGPITNINSPFRNLAKLVLKSTLKPQKEVQKTILVTQPDKELVNRDTKPDTKSITKLSSTLIRRRLR